MTEEYVRERSVNKEKGADDKERQPGQRRI